MHFATHGLLNSEHPELSGLVLSLVDQQGRPQDGFLQLQDIYNLNLPADLVVLSACETGLGKEIRGEGLMGLTRGFMYAGASRVIASLWKVDDVATAELMKRLYHGMLTEGLQPAAALRQSQIEMWKQPAMEVTVLLGGVCHPGGVEIEAAIILPIRWLGWRQRWIAPVRDNLTREGLDRLLARLDPDLERAGEKYRNLHRKLVKLFEWRRRLLC